MPATETYWRDQNLLNQLFALTGVVLLGVTVWMFAADHNREWKNYQTEANDVELAMNLWRQNQQELERNLLRHGELSDELLALRSAPLPKDPETGKPVIETFKNEYNKYVEEQGKTPDPSLFAGVDQLATEVDALAKTAAEKRTARDAVLKQGEAALTALRAAEDKLPPLQAALDAAKAKLGAVKPEEKAAAQKEVDAAAAAVAANEKEGAAADAKLQEARQAARQANDEVQAAEQAAANKKEELVAKLSTFIRTIEFDESKLLTKKKFTSASFDAARAKLGLMVRDNRPAKEQEAQQAKVDEVQDALHRVTLDYQAVQKHRLAMQAVVKAITEQAAEAQKSLEALDAEKKRLEKSYEDQKSTWLVDYPPFLGKKWLELPIIDAFNTPLKIDNLHFPKLRQDYNFTKVARIDRCTTCHQLIDRSLPGQPTTPAYVPEHELVFALETPPRPTTEALKNADGSDKTPAELLRELYGLQVTTGAPARQTADDVVVQYIARESRAATARILSGAEEQDDHPGLMVGDVIAKVGNDKVLDPALLERFLLDTVKWGQSVKLTVKRGLRNPYVTHPRLDLYMSSLSPHPLPTFGCTTCHEGQGTATAFKYGSHAPDTLDAERRWSKEHGWFDNHHWIYPMYEKRFAEATCLKCHHEVVELERSERFLDTPAPKLTEGHELIRRFGCFGCHEINGYDGGRRVGPDMRLEPNFFAIAQQLEFLLDKSKLAAAPAAAPPAAADPAAHDRAAAAAAEEIAAIRELAAKLVEHPEDSRTRERIRDRLEQDQQAALAKKPTVFPAAAYDLIGLLKDPESAGTLRRVGPSLRFVGHKIDEPFMYDWIGDPSHFRPTTLMPKFFGHWNHLDGADLKKSQEFEPVEVLGITKYLAARTQPFEYEKPSELPPGKMWHKDEKPEDQVARGKTEFAVRGCLACHNHGDFPDATKLRGKEIPQGPDLTGLGTKFDPARNEHGPQWLYSWVKNPSRYHARTKMPLMFLNPAPYRAPLPKDAAPAPAPADPAAPTTPAPVPEPTEFTDPAADIVAYLMGSTSDWKPPTPADLTPDTKALDAVALEYLKGAYAEERARSILKVGRDAAHQAELDKTSGGIAEAQRATTKGIEVELLGAMTDEKKLLYIGRKAINKFGCFGCHDIPGFEDAKPIGTGLADWGRKNPVMLAFGHIAEYYHHQEHGAAHADPPAAAADPHAKPGPETPAAGDAHAHVVGPVKGIRPTPTHELDEFYKHKVHAGSRIGFIGQKLNEPRSYDYKDLIKPYNDRLRMPRFPLNGEQREAVITFVLGLIADPPHADYLYTPKPRKQAELAGRVVLEKYNCGGCHMIEMDRFKISYKPGEIPPQDLAPIFPFLIETPLHGDPNTRPDAQGNVHGILVGAQALGEDTVPLMLGATRDPLTLEQRTKAEAGDKDTIGDTGAPSTWAYALQLYRRHVLYDFAKDDMGNPLRSAEGTPLLIPRIFEPGDTNVGLPVGALNRRYEPFGGFLVRLNAARMLALEKSTNAAAAKSVGKDTWSWLPPPLYDEGTKVEAEWLHSFLLEPYQIRPAVARLRMPKFNMSPDEATALVNYFAARDGAEYPYKHDERRRSAPLAEANARFLREAQAAGVELKGDRLGHAMRLLTGICAQCHKIGDFTPDGDPLAQAPNLADAHKRLQRDYLKRWIADPKRILPYTLMPQNFPYKPDELPLKGGAVAQKYYHGTSIDQIEAIVDLLVNFDEYAKSQSNVKRLVEEIKKEVPPMPAPGATPGPAPTP